jgi:putative flippase GtrA
MPEPAAPADGGGRLVARLYAPFRSLAHEVAKFGIVGALAFVIDVGLFNLLLYFGPLEDKPLTAKVVSVVAATTFAYFGNRFWTYRHRGRRSMRREYVLFFVFNGIALLISVGCLWFSHYVLGLDSPLADNISANVVGVLLGTLFRFVAYRTWVFPAIPEDDVAEREMAERDASTPI